MTLSLPVPSNDVFSRVFIESSALKQTVAIHSGITSEQTNLISSQAREGPENRRNHLVLPVANVTSLVK
ncbi:hypothetical protein TNCV_638681 [Trichonephila clavipes]|nr:hypothetical protein TNCV_638681 [Trichonephila clavipes]